MINLDVTRAATPHGYYYAPDPSSQQICSIGGNVAENSGGAHCLKYGFTTNHVLGADFVTAEGDIVALGGAAPDSPGYDLLGAVVGSEGTLGIVTSATVRLVRLPEEVRTLLVGFESHRPGGRRDLGDHRRRHRAGRDRDDGRAGHRGRRGGGALRLPRRRRRGAGHRARRRRGRGRAGVRRGRAAVRRERRLRAAGRDRPGRPGADLEGPQVRVRRGRPDQPRLHRPGRRHPADRAARGAAARSPTLSRRPRASGWPTSSTPATATCTRSCSSTTPSRAPGEAAEKVSGAILDLCIEHGGSITGEHGVGMDKAAYMPRMFTDEDLDTMQLVRCAFDPDRHLQPRQGLPDAAAVRRGARPHQGRAPAAGGRPGGGLLMATDDPRRARRARRSPRPARDVADAADGRPRRRRGARRWSPARPTPTRWPRCCAPPPPTGSPSCRAAAAPS